MHANYLIPTGFSCHFNLPSSYLSLQTDWQDAHERLFNLLEAKPSNPAIPVLVIIMGDPSDTSNVQAICEAGLRLQELQHAGLLSTYHVMRLAMDVEDPSASEEVSGWKGYL